MAVDPANVARFAGDMAAVLGRTVVPDELVALAVSGGPDSMAMLVLAVSAFPGQVIAATMDHRLRPAAADEAAMVAAYCATIGVAHRILHPAGAIDRANVQAGARSARYQALGAWAAGAGARMLATAHHADDQAETFLMRAARGSGVAGLAGIRPRQPLEGADAVELVRPLLGWRADALRALAIAADVPFVDDPSNTDARYDRTHFRALLAANPVLDPVRIAGAAAHAAEADSALRAMEAWLWQACTVAPQGAVNPDDQRWLVMASLPRELKRRLCRAAIASVRRARGITRPEFSDASNVESLLDALDAGKTATQAGVIVSESQGIWRFTEEPARRSH